MSEPGRSLQCVVLQTGELQPTDPARARALGERQGEVVTVRVLDAADLRSEAQLRYWFGAVVRTIQACWRDERGRLYAKEEVHAALMTAFGGGPVQTPLGVAHPSSRLKTKREFSEITDAARAYAREVYDVHIPSPDEWSEAMDSEGA